MIDIFPDKNRFLKLCADNKIIPVAAQMESWSFTPIELYEQLGKDNAHSFLFNTGKEGADSNRYSFIGYNPALVFISKGERIKITGDESEKLKGNPLTCLQELIDRKKHKRFEYLSHFYGGYVGYFAYDIVRFFENIPLPDRNDRDIPDIYLFKIDELVVIDHFYKLLKIIVCVKNNEKGYDSAIAKINAVIKKIKKHDAPPNPDQHDNAPISIKKNPNKHEFLQMVETVKKYIVEGDIYQANISHKIEIKYHKDPFDLYKKIININPSPFAVFFKMEGTYLVSCSPERLLRVKGNRIDTRPIAGTRPRGKDSFEDSQLSKRLLSHEKERAEHIMLIDLERNDLSKVCEYGSVTVDEFMTLEKYSHVWHIVSNVKGILKDDVKFIDILQACFPGGTITGCPKVRCMEIINELEKTSRGYYTGSFGYIGYNGDIDLNILIRTILIKDNHACFHIGAGIVADSCPEKEYYETMDKAKAMIKALDIVFID